MAQLVSSTISTSGTISSQDFTGLSTRARLREVQTHLCVPKSMNNNFGNYKYRNVESILAAANPLLAKYGLTLTMTEEPYILGERYYLKCTATVADDTGKDTVSVSTSVREAKERKGMDVAQITGSAISYARKYALGGLFCIDDGRDYDAMDNRDVGTEQPKAQVKAPAKAEPPKKSERAILLERIGDYAKKNSIPFPKLTQMAQEEYKCECKAGELPDAQLRDFARRLPELWADQAVPF